MVTRTNWDERYRGDDYLFGTAPNDFLESVVEHLGPGATACLADGEGRNGVFLAGRGFDVVSLDASQVALDKAKRLAAKQNVSLALEQADLFAHDLGEGRWQNIVSIFFHMPSEIRERVHAGVVRALAPGGHVVLESYTPRQLGFGTGGPPFEDYLVTAVQLEQEFAGLEFLHLVELEREVVEGTGHTGRAAVVQMLARKPN